MVYLHVEVVVGVVVVEVLVEVDVLVDVEVVVSKISIQKSKQLISCLKMFC